MANLNKVMIIGNLGADPEIRYTQQNNAVTTMRVATSEVWTDKQSGDRKESTEWHRIVVWGRQAENCEKYLKKGSLVYVEGNLRTREWQDKEGQRRWTTEIKAQRVQFLDKFGAGGGESRPSPPPPGDAEAGFDQGFSDDEIPF